MKRVLLFVFVIAAFAFKTKAQQSYWTNQGEYIFSWSQYTGETGNGSTRTRFTLFPNNELVYNLDSRGIFGTYFGLSLKNIGLNWGDTDKHKRRSLSLGVPLAIKIGDLENDNFFFFGGEAEVFFHYKKKDWNDGQKIKTTEWFSDEINIFQPSVMVGYTMNKFMFKVKYYLFDFFNPDFTHYNNGVAYNITSPSNIFYFGIAFRQDIGGNNFDFDDDEEDEDDGFDFGYNQTIDMIYQEH